MSEQRRRELEALLDAAARFPDEPSSRVGVICRHAVAQLGVSGAGATVLTSLADGEARGTRRGLVHATDDVSAGLEDLQLTLGEGPCLDAFTLGGPVLIADLLEALDRWPAFTAEARRLGAVAVFSFPIRLGAIALGSLDFYCDQPAELGESAVTDALLLSDLAAQAIMVELDGHDTEDLGWLVDPHAEVHQATGMVKVQLGATPEQALLRLRAHAYTEERSLAEISRRVLAQELDFRPNPDPSP